MSFSDPDFNLICSICYGMGVYPDFNHHSSCDGGCSGLCPVQKEGLVVCDFCKNGIPPIPYSELIRPNKSKNGIII